MERAFIFGKPVSYPYFTNREKEMTILLNEIKMIRSGGAVNLAVLGQRRIGKTSLINNLISGIDKEEDIIPVFIDCMSMPSLRRLSTYIADYAKDNYIIKRSDQQYMVSMEKYLKKNISELLSKIPQIDLSIASYISFKISLEEKEVDQETLFENSLNYLETLGNKKDVYFVLIFDEFSEIALRWGDDFVKLIRTLAQQQERVMYVFSSSATTYMNDLVYNSTSPFYRQLKPITIGPLPEEDTRNFILERIQIAGRTIDDRALEKWIKLTNGLPDYVQRLGDVLLDITTHNMIEEEDIDNAYEEIFITLDPVFNLLFTKLSEKSQIYSDILISIAQYEQAAMIANDIGIPKSSLHYYLPYLLNLGIIKKPGKGKYELIDPLFKQWMINKFHLKGL